MSTPNVFFSLFLLRFGTLYSFKLVFASLRFWHTCCQNSEFLTRITIMLDTIFTPRSCFWHGLFALFTKWWGKKNVLNGQFFSQVGVILQLKRERAQSVAKSRLLLSTVWLSKQLRQSYLVGFRFFVLDSFSCRRVLLLQRSGHHLGWWENETLSL